MVATLQIDGYAPISIPPLKAGEKITIVIGEDGPKLVSLSVPVSDDNSDGAAIVRAISKMGL